jgi:CheY-like chemotaxis protein
VIPRSEFRPEDRQLQALIDSGGPAGESAQPGDYATMTGERPFVLLVEDDPVNRTLAKRILTAHNYPFAEAVDGAAALDAIADRRPDVILMDLSLPVMNGWEATERIRRDPDLAGIRILAVTANAMAGDRERALSAGCDDYLTKPFRPAELVAALERLTADLVTSQSGATGSRDA